MKKRNLYLFLFLLFFCGTPLLSSAQKHIRTEQPTHTRELAKQMYRQGNYAGCIDLMRSYRPHAAEPADKAAADYYIAAAAYRAKDRDALALLESYTVAYPETPQSEEIKLLTAHAYFDKGDFKKSAALYNAIDLDRLTPDQQADLLLHLGIAYTHLGKNDDAERCFGAVIAVGGEKKNAALYRNAYLHYVEKEYEKAGEGFAYLLDDKEFAQPSSAFLTQSYFARNEYKKAIDEGNRYLQTYPKDSVYYEITRVIGESHFRSGRPKEAVEYLSDYTAHTAAPLRSSLYTLGVACYESGACEDAVSTLGRVTDQTDALAQNAYLYIGQSYLKLNDKTNARLAFEMASRYTFDRKAQETALYNYAMLLHTGTFSPFAESVTVFEKFLNLFPTSRYASTVSDNLADVYLTTRNYETALRSINKIKRPDAKILKAKQRILYRLGTERFADNDLDRAADYFAQAIRVGSYDKEAKADAYLWHGECLYRKGKYAEAAKDGINYLNTAVRKNPQAYYNLGYAYFKQHDFTNAARRFGDYLSAEQQSPANMPRIADAHTRRADCLYAQRDFVGAEAYYGRAVELCPATGDYALYQKGIMAGLQKNPTEKAAIMQEVVRKYPESDYADDALLEEGLTHVALRDGKAAGCFLQLLDNYPQQETARKAGLQLGMVYYNSRQPQKAIDAYKRVISTYPGSDEARLALQDLKAIYIEQNKVDDYAAYLKTVSGDVKTEVSELDSLSFLVAERAFLKQPDAASAAQLEQYLKKYPAGAYTLPAHNYLSRYHYDKKAYGKARKELDYILKQPNNPYTGDALLRLADIQEHDKEYAEAFRSYQKLEPLAQNKEVRQTARVGMMRTAQKCGMHKEVIAVTDKLLAEPSLSPECARDAHTARAESFMALGNTAKAAAEWEVLAQDPRTEIGAKSAYLLAQYHLDNNNDTEAEAVVTRLLETGTSHQYWLARCFIVLSDVYALRGDYFQAKQYLLSLQNNYKGDDDIEKLIAVRLQKLQTAQNSTNSDNR